MHAEYSECEGILNVYRESGGNTLRLNVKPEIQRRYE